MRDEERIARTINLLWAVWEKYPDWRLGQLIENIARDMGWDDAYYVEDDVLQKELRKHIDLP